jgi:drug/metabolite transporter (DMT)-like permease
MPPLPSGVQTGVALAVMTAVLWAVSPLFIASVGRRIGSFNTNLLRASLAAVTLLLVVLPALALVRGRGFDWPPVGVLVWVVGSGVMGMVVGDACFYEALVLLGPRRAVKVNTLAPVVTLGIGWVALDETLTARALIGAGLIIAAVTYAAFAQTAPPGQASREPGRVSAFGLLCGVGSAVFIALGAVLMRLAYRTPGGEALDPILATTVRVGSAAAILWTIPLARGRAGAVLAHLNDGDVRRRLAVGTLLGAFLGMMCFISAFKYAPAGLVSTISATSPLVILPLVAWRYHVRIGWGLVVAGAVAVVGVGMIAWK